MAIGVLIADDQTLIRQGVKVILRPEPDIQVVGEAENGQEAIDKVVSLHPDLVLMDVVMPGCDGIAATREIKERSPQTQILILTVYADQTLFRRAAEAGAIGYVLKDISPANLANAIRAAHNGRTTLSPVIARQMIDHFHSFRGTRDVAPVRAGNGLTPREIDVLTGVTEGLSDKEIAAKLFLSESTVKTHLRAIYHRHRLRNRAQAVVFAIERRLVKTA